MEQTDPRHLLIEITKILNRLKIPHIVTGGMAVFVWGRPRFTADIDIIVEFREKNIKPLVQELAKLDEFGYVDEKMMQEALFKKGEFNYIHTETGVKVDFWVLKNNPFGKSCLRRQISKKILGQKVSFISPEDLILSKLNWYKRGGSARHLEDIESILKISKVDVRYINKWAKQQSTTEILKEVLN